MATALVVVVITYVSIVIGELVPKRIGQFNPEASRVAWRGRCSWLALAHASVRAAARLLDRSLLQPSPASASRTRLTEEEIHAMLEEGSVAA